MIRKFLRSHLPAVVGVATLALWLGATAVVSTAWREAIRENAFDLVLFADQYVTRIARGDARVGNRIVIIDIDRRTLETLGTWPWPRDIMAQLVDSVAAAKPAAIALDILFAETDSRSPAALARRLGAFTGRADLQTLADELPDGDRRLSAALRSAPAVLGFVLDPDQAAAVPAAPIIARGPLP